jgi:DNA-binding MarR family transcriptional regulator
MVGNRTAKKAAPESSDRPQIAYLIGRLDRALRRRMGEALGPFSLSVTQYTTLSVLHIRGQLSNAQLASRALISPQSMNEVVQSLEALKLVTRQADPSHARIVQLRLTAQGIDVLHHCDAAIKQLEQSMLARLSPEAREALRESLNECVQVLEDHVRAAAAP